MKVGTLPLNHMGPVDCETQRDVLVASVTSPRSSFEAVIYSTELLANPQIGKEVGHGWRLQSMLTRDPPVSKRPHP